MGMNEPDVTDITCYWPLPHRFKHGPPCACHCVLEKDHAGRHRCVVDVIVDEGITA